MINNPQVGKIRPTIYVAGKYSGDTKENTKFAEIVSIELLKKGWAVFTPHKNFFGYEVEENLTYWDFMEAGLSILISCDAIFMLSNWKDSKGAVIEHNFAKKMYMDIFYQEDGYPSTI